MAVVLLAFGSSSSVVLSIGQEYDGQESFTDLEENELPSITTRSAEDITSDSALLRGEVESLGRIDEKEFGIHFYWRETNREMWDKLSVGAVDEEGLFDMRLSNLDSGTTYEYYASVDCAQGNTPCREDGVVKTFRTLSETAHWQVQTIEDWRNYAHHYNNTWINNDRLELQREYALEFDGEDGRVDVGDPSDLEEELMGDKTISMWISPDEIMDGERRGVWDQAYWESGGTIIEEPSDHGYADDQWLNYFYGGGEDWQWEGFGTTMTREEVELGEWYHVVLVRDINEDSLEWWINGQRDALYEGLPYEAETPGVEDLLIGDGDSFWEYETYYGRIDDFRIYDRPLTQTGIEELYENRYKEIGDEAAWWPMNEGLGGTVYDFSHNDNHGDIIDAQWVDIGAMNEGDWASVLWEAPFDQGSYVREFETTAEIGDDQTANVRVGVDETDNDEIDVWSDWKELNDGMNNFSGEDLDLPNGYRYGIEYRLQAEGFESPWIEDFMLEVQNITSPLVDTLYPEDITYESAVLKGELIETSGLNSIDLYFCWRETGGEWQEVLVEEGVNEPQIFEYELSALESNVYHEFYAYAEGEHEAETFRGEGVIHIFFTGDELTWSSQDDWENAVKDENIEIDGDSIRLSPTILEREESGCDDWDVYHHRENLICDEGDLVLENNPALQFDGETSYTEIPYDESLQISDEITLSAWVYRSDVNYFDLIAGNGGGWDDHGYQLIGNTAGGIRFELQGDNDKTAVDSQTETSDRWHHVVGVWDADSEEMKIYVDGVEENSATFTGPIGISPHDLGIGYGLYDTYGGGHWEGLIDEVRIYDRSLSEKEIQNLYEREQVEEGLVSWWPIDSGSGDTIFDGSSNENHGNIHDAEWIDPNYIGPHNEEGIGRRISLPLNLDQIDEVSESIIEWDSTETDETDIEIETAVLERNVDPLDPIEVFEATSTGMEGEVQNWTVPETGVYEINVRGAQGGGQYGGRGALVSGEFELAEGEVLWIVTGHQGLGPEDTGMENGHGTGGGASYVAVEDEDGELIPLLVAGGGGANDHGESVEYEHHGRTTERGGEAFQDGGGETGSPGYDGNGGTGDDGGSYPPVWGGAGWLTGNDGNAEAIRDDPTGCSDTTFEGGFGGGGSSDGSGWSRTAGGGGYSGGAGARGENWAVGGGGGSFVNDSADSVDRIEGENQGSGEVVIYRDHWKEAESGEPIPEIEEGDDLTGKVLWVRQTLSTNDSTQTPRLHSLNVEIENKLREGRLLTWSKSMIESKPDLIDLEYELNGQEISIDAIGSPGTEEEEVISGIVLEGQEFVALDWDQSHLTYQILVEMESLDGESSPELDSLSLGKEPPIIASQEAQDITLDSAVLHGEIIDMASSDSLEAFFQYREEGMDTWYETSRSELEEAQSFSVEIDDLNSGTKYEFRAAAEWQYPEGYVNQEYGTTLDFITMVGLSLDSTEGGHTQPEEGEHTFEYGEEVGIQAMPDEGWDFSQWEGDVSEEHEEDEEITLVMDEDKTLTAHFVEYDPEIEHELTVDIEGEGFVEIDGTAVEVPYSEKYEEDTEIELRAVSDEGWYFDGWTGDSTETDEKITVIMDDDKEFKANFLEYDPEIEHELTVDIEGEGFVEIDGTAVEIPYKEEYQEGSQVELKATPDEEWQFSHWLGDYPDGEQEETTIDVVMEGDRALTAYFERVDPDVERELTINVEGEGTTDPESGIHNYLHGEAVSVRASPEEGWVFSEWTGDHTGTEEEITIVMDDDKNITAHFEEDVEVETYDLVINIEGDGTTYPEPGEHAFPRGEDVMIEAIPDEGWVFVEWTGDYEGEEQQITVTMDSDKEVTAHFYEPDEWYEFKLNIEGDCLVEIGGDEIEDGWEHQFGEGERVVLEAIPEEGWTFSHWSGDVPEGEEDEMQITVNIDGDKEITAHFEEVVEVEEDEEGLLSSTPFAGSTCFILLLVIILAIIIAVILLWSRSKEEDEEDELEEMKRSEPSKGVGVTAEEDVLEDREEKRVPPPVVASDKTSSEETSEYVGKKKETRIFREEELEEELGEEELEEELGEEQLEEELGEEELEEELGEEQLEEEMEEIPKEEAVEELKKLKGIGTSKAETLYQTGYRSIEDLKEVSKEELKEIKGIGPALSEKIIESVKEFEEKS